MIDQKIFPQSYPTHDSIYPFSHASKIRGFSTNTTFATVSITSFDFQSHKGVTIEMASSIYSVKRMDICDNGKNNIKKKEQRKEKWKIK